MNLFGLDAATWEAQRYPVPPNQLMARLVDELLATARAAYPALVPTRIRLPTQAGTAPFQIDGTVPGHALPWGPGASVEVDPTTGRVRAVRRAWEARWPARWEALVGPLHFGTVGGWPLRVVYVVVGLAPGWLALTGFALWYRRRPRRASA